MLIKRLLLIYSVRENTQCPILCFVVNTPTQLNMLSLVKYKNSNLPDYKKSKYYLATAAFKKNCSEYNL